MARNIFIVNASQTVVSDSHPEGLYSVVTGYPKTFDSRSYASANGNPNGDPEKALMAARAEYYSRLSAFCSGSDTRVMGTVTLEQADGRTIIRDSVGAFPDIPVADPGETVIADE